MPQAAGSLEVRRDVLGLEAGYQTSYLDDVLQGTFEEEEAVGQVVAVQRENALTFSTEAPHKCHFVLELILLIQIRTVLFQQLSPTGITIQGSENSKTVGRIKTSGVWNSTVAMSVHPSRKPLGKLVSVGQALCGRQRKHEKVKQSAGKLSEKSIWCLPYSKGYCVSKQTLQPLREGEKQCVCCLNRSPLCRLSKKVIKAKVLVFS